MSGNETVYTLGAMVLLSAFILHSNQVAAEYRLELDRTRYRLEALALGSSFIEELSQLPFDEASWDSTSYSKSVSDFTQANSLGPESGETSADLFDDFDDTLDEA